MTKEIKNVKSPDWKPHHQQSVYRCTPLSIYSINTFALTLFLVFSACNIPTENSVITPDKTELNGNWVIESATVFPIVIPSNCDTLLAGDILAFDNSEILYVISQQDTCGYYIFRFDTVSRQIELVKNDMIFYLYSVTLNTNRLSFVSKGTKFPEHTTEQHMTILENGNKINLIRKK